jgi:tRNA 2-selenouridine synthase
VIEAESSKIGKLIVPPSIWTAMLAAPRIEITAPLAARAAFLTQAYAQITEDPKTVATQLDHLRRVRGHAVVDHWITLLDGGDLPALATALMVDHYDPAYAKSRRQAPLAVIKAEALNEDGLENAATEIAAVVSRLLSPYQQ